MKIDTTEAMIEMIRNPGKELFRDENGNSWKYEYGKFLYFTRSLCDWHPNDPRDYTLTRIEQEKSNDEVARHIMSQEGGPKTFMSLLLDEVDRRIARQWREGK